MDWQLLLQESSSHLKGEQSLLVPSGELSVWSSEQVVPSGMHFLSDAQV